MEDKPPERKNPKTKEAVAVEIVQEKMLWIYEKLFTALAKKDPTFVDRMKPDYDEYIKNYLVMIKEFPDGNWTALDLQKRIPQNKWAHLLDQSAGLLPKAAREISQKTQEHFSEMVQRRIEGKDLN